MIRKRLLAGVLLMSISGLIFELSLVRIFSVVLFSNLAFLGITFALLGVSLGGLMVYLFPKYFSEEKYRERLIRYGWCYVASIFFYVIIFLQFNMAEGGIGKLFLVIILSSVPFTLINICLTLIFKYNSREINKIYFCDLLGAGIGGGLVVLLLNILTGINVLFVAGILGIVAILFFYQQPVGRKVFLGGLVLAAIILGVLLNHHYNFIKIIYSRGGLETGVNFEKWNSFSRVTVNTETHEELPYLYLSDAEEKARKLKEIDINVMGVKIDSGAYTPILGFNGDLEQVKFLRKEILAAAFAIKEPGEALVIGTGGGHDLLAALSFGHQVKGIEINPIIVNDIMKGKFKDFSGGIYLHPQVDVKLAEGRSFINRSNEKYDIIDIPMVDTWSATMAGNLVLVESNLYTVEAFDDYFNHLKPGGILSLSRWEYDGLRLVSLFLETAKRQGIKDPEKCLVVISKEKANYVGSYNNYLFKATPFTDDEMGKINQFVKESNLSIIYNPYRPVVNNYSYYDYLGANDRQRFRNNYPLNINPVYDDKPFYFFLVPISKLFSPQNSLTLVDGGLGVVFEITLLLVILFIVVPFIYNLLWTNNIKLPKVLLMGYLGYFASLGLAFMFLEIVLIQKFILYLEQPIYSYSVVLVTILIFAGLGSYWSQFIKTKKSNYFKLGLIIFIFTLIFVGCSRFVIINTIADRISVKITLAILLNIPIALLMGIMMPLGIRKLNERGINDLIPWCWAINGATSVLASVLAIIIAVAYGFNMVIILGGIIYLLCGFWLLLDRANNS